MNIYWRLQRQFNFWHVGSKIKILTRGEGETLFCCRKSCWRKLFSQTHCWQSSFLTHAAHEIFCCRSWRSLSKSVEFYKRLMPALRTTTCLVLSRNTATLISWHNLFFSCFMCRSQVSSTSECKTRGYSLTRCVGSHTQPCLWPPSSVLDMNCPCWSDERKPRIMVGNWKARQSFVYPKYGSNIYGLAAAWLFFKININHGWVQQLHTFQGK